MRIDMLTKRVSLLLLGAAVIGLAGCDDRRSAAAPSNTSLPEQAQAAKRLDTAARDSWITIGGKVVSAAPDSFVLDYGYGRATVGMANWD
jgi:hypothetical protein